MTETTAYERRFEIPAGIYHDNQRWWTWYQPTVAAALGEARSDGEPETTTVSLLSEDGLPACTDGLTVNEPRWLLVQVKFARSPLPDTSARSQP